MHFCLRKNPRKKIIELKHVNNVPKVVPITLPSTSFPNPYHKTLSFFKDISLKMYWGDGNSFYLLSCSEKSIPFFHLKPKRTTKCQNASNFSNSNE